MKLIDLGSALVETKQVDPTMPIVFDTKYGLARL
jgi:hypothetical protein